MIPDILSNKEGWERFHVSRCTVEQALEFRRWALEVPFFEIPKGIEISPIPPFGGAVARFRARLVGEKDPNNACSIYLDCYDQLGYMGGKPYWEVYGPHDDEPNRCMINETKRLVNLIQASLKGGNNKWNINSMLKWLKKTVQFPKW